MASRQRGMKATVIGLSVMLGIMITLTAFSVPLYNMFCKVTGYGGTTRVASEVKSAEGRETRILKIRFNADTAKDMPWRFQPEQTEIEIKVGERSLAFFKSSNPSDRPILGQAVYNVTPAKMGQYFNKIECFCFSEQLLRPGEEVDMPVSFFLDPEMLDDDGVDDVTTVTLSYTFFNAGEERLEAYLADHPGALDEERADAGDRVAAAPSTASGAVN